MFFRKRGPVQEEEEEGPDSSDEETPIQFQVTEEFRCGESHSVQVTE